MVTFNSREIELFKNLSQFDLSKVNYDFHNDFDCIKILFERTFLVLLFKRITDSCLVSFKFENVFLEGFQFFNFEEFKNLTVDNIYRGRFQIDDELFEFNDDGKSYFYIEFYEGPKIELWCESIVVGEMEKQ